MIKERRLVKEKIGLMRAKLVKNLQNENKQNYSSLKKEEK